MYTNSNEIRFGLYSKLAFDVIKFSLTTFSHSYLIEAESFIQRPDNEVTYYEKDNWRRKFKDPASVLEAKRNIAKCIRALMIRAAKIDGVVPTYVSSVSTSQIRGLSQEARSKQHSLSYHTRDEARQLHKIDNSYTLEQLAYLIDFLGCYKDRKKIDEDYSIEVRNSIIGKPADPFTATALEAIFKQIEEIKAERDIALENLHNEIRLKEEAIRDVANKKIIELRSKFDLFRAESIDFDA